MSARKKDEMTTWKDPQPGRVWHEDACTDDRCVCHEHL